MQSPFLLELPCVGRYGHQSGCELAAFIRIPQQPDSPPTHCEISIACRLESTAGGGRERTLEGEFDIREFSVTQGGEKAGLTVSHRFHIEITLSS